MSSPGQVAEEKLNLFITANKVTLPVGNIYYVLRKRSEDGGKTEFKKVDCRYHYTGNFQNVYVSIEDEWFRIDCFDPLQKDGVSGTIMHQTNDLMEFGIEYLPNTKRTGNKIETGNQ